MEIEKRLDDILELLDTVTLDNKVAPFEYIKTQLKYDNTVKLQSLLNYLQEERLIDCINSLRDGHGNMNIGNINVQQEQGNPYYITIKGRLFGGYVNGRKKRLRDATLQTLAIWVTAGGTALAGLYGLVEILKWIARYLCH